MVSPCQRHSLSLIVPYITIHNIVSINHHHHIKNEFPFLHPGERNGYHLLCTNKLRRQDTFRMPNPFSPGFGFWLQQAVLSDTVPDSRRSSSSRCCVGRRRGSIRSGNSARRRSYCRSRSRSWSRYGDRRSRRRRYSIRDTGVRRVRVSDRDSVRSTIGRRRRESVGRTDGGKRRRLRRDRNSH